MSKKLQDDELAQRFQEAGLALLAELNNPEEEQ